MCISTLLCMEFLPVEFSLLEAISRVANFAIKRQNDVETRRGARYSSDSEIRRLHSGAAMTILQWLALPGRISVRPRRWRWQIEMFCFQLALHLLNGALELLIFAFEFFTGIIIDNNIRINPMAFDNPLFALFGINRELRFE